MINFTITPTQLTWMIGTVEPMAGRDRIEGETVNSIRLQSEAGAIYTSATNRYVAGIARTNVKITSGLDIMIDREDLLLTRRLYPVPRRRLTDEHRIIVAVDDKIARFSQPDARPAVTVEFEIVQASPNLDLRSKMRQWIDSRRSPGRPVSFALDPQHLRRFAHLGHHVEFHLAKAERPNSPSLPVLVFADRFAGAIMTRHMGASGELVAPWSLQPVLPEPAEVVS